jgi:hypothetical protein
MAYKVPQVNRAVHLVFALLLIVATLGFTIAPASSPRHGTEADAATFDGQPATFTATAATIGPRVTRTTWQSSIGGARIECRTETTLTGFEFSFEVQNGWTHRLDSLDIRLPEIAGASDTRIYSPLRGGMDIAPSEGWTQGSSGNWPGAGYMAGVTFHNKAETLALTYLNRQLKPVMCFWFASRGNVNPFLRYRLDLDPGESITLSADYRVMQGGPATHWSHYRQYRLMPFMRDMGIPEATLDLPPGHIAYSNWTDDIRRDVAAAKAKGAAAYIQWSPPDAHSYFYNPYPPSLPWFNDLPAPGLPVGVLINPFVSPPLLADRVALTTDARYTHTNLQLDLGANRAYNARLRDALKARNVSLAFFDTGGEPGPRQGHEWLRLLSDWKRAGISVLPETSCDIAAYCTGVWMEYPYSRGRYDLARVVTPKATLTVHTNWDDPGWAEHATKQGLRPIIHVEGL